MEKTPDNGNPMNKKRPDRIPTIIFEELKSQRPDMINSGSMRGKTLSMNWIMRKINDIPLSIRRSRKASFVVFVVSVINGSNRNVIAGVSNRLT
jgi:hypothetical protein